MNKKNLVLLFGGRSSEHNVSLESAKNVASAIDPQQFQLHLIGIDRNGIWHAVDAELLQKTDVAKPIQLENSGPQVFIVPSPSGAKIIRLDNGESIGQADVVFPVMHGTLGEDGAIQGFLRMLDLPFVGCGILASSVGMDKDFTKRILRDAGIPVADFVTLQKDTASSSDFARLTTRLGLPFFLKPANQGSSVGVHKVADANKFASALQDAFKYDTKLMVEKFVKGREIECSVLGNRLPKVSAPGEVMPQHDFYSYEAKYLDENGALLKIPADLSEALTKKVQALALRTYEVLGCEGLARVDFFLTENGEVYVNEINTIPGFTKISMYPKMWSQSGLNYTELINKLISLAIERTVEDRTLVR